MSYAIECQNLSKVYSGRVEAVRNLTLGIEPRQVYGFLGPNGAGKTTTIRMLLDLIRPTSGRITLFGESVYRNSAALKNVGALVEGASFYPYLSGWDNLQVYGWTSRTFDPNRAKHLLEVMGLAGREKDAVGKYSTGMKQRLGIAAALLHDPQLVILDEPTNGLDPAGIYAMRKFIRSLVDEQGKTVFLSSHLLGEVQQICDRVAIIHKGNLLAEGRVDDLLRQRSTERLLIEVHPLERAQAVLANQWDVSLDSQSNVLVVLTHREGIPQIIRKLAAADIDIYAMQHQHISLEEFFLSITEHEAGG
jgi:ABC-2 type transport system ATP-binding protein